MGETTEDAPAPRTGLVPLVRVVDDEPDIVQIVERIARRCGFDASSHASAGAFLAALDPAHPGCVLLDQSLPDRSGLEILRELCARECALPVLFISGSASVPEAVQALKLGCLDFLQKPFGIDDVAMALRRAVELDAEQRRIRAELRTLQLRFASLTARETQVMEEIVRGAANKEVAARLGLSPKTVEVHRASVMRKTRAASLAELVRLHVAAAR